jgi:hypothetical protein
MARQNYNCSLCPAFEIDEHKTGQQKGQVRCVGFAINICEMKYTEKEFTIDKAMPQPNDYVTKSVQGNDSHGCLIRLMWRIIISSAVISMILRYYDFL